VTRGGRWTKLALPAVPLLAALAGVGVVGHAWEVRTVEVEGVRLFDPAPVRKALEEALGRPPVAASASALREKVLAIPWVEDAQVSVELSGAVRCLVRERTPAALLADGNPPQLLDATGRVLGPARGSEPLVSLVGFAPYPEERQLALALLPRLAEAWGKPVRLCQRLAARDLAVSFGEEDPLVLLDPQRPEALVRAKQVLAAWEASGQGKLARVDVRVPGKVFCERREESQ